MTLFFLVKIYVTSFLRLGIIVGQSRHFAIQQHTISQSVRLLLNSKGNCQNVTFFLSLTVVMHVVVFCPVGPLGACGVIDGKSYNLGYIQSKPQVAEGGSISIMYQNGDKCGSTSRYSTRIILQCDDNPVNIRAPTETTRRCLVLSK